MWWLYVAVPQPFATTTWSPPTSWMWSPISPAARPTAASTTAPTFASTRSTAAMTAPATTCSTRCGAPRSPPSSDSWSPSMTTALTCRGAPTSCRTTDTGCRCRGSCPPYWSEQRPSLPTTATLTCWCSGVSSLTTIWTLRWPPSASRGSPTVSSAPRSAPMTHRASQSSSLPMTHGSCVAAPAACSLSDPARCVAAGWHLYLWTVFIRESKSTS